MAIRPIFYSGLGAKKVVLSKDIEFRWHPGYSASQKQKNIIALHSAANRLGFSRTLEVSSKSDTEVGRRLSAFSIKLNITGDNCYLESVYQGSKVFEKGGPFHEIYNMNPLDAKRYFRDAALGKITHFQIYGEKFENLPMNAFYDWLFIRALAPHAEYLKKNVFIFDAFSDIEFNPSKSFNTQARSVALLKGLYERGLLERAHRDFQFLRTTEGEFSLPVMQRSML